MLTDGATGGDFKYMPTYRDADGNVVDKSYPGLDVEFDLTEEEAIEIARENSIEVINSYSCIYEELEETIQNYIDENDEEMLKEEIDELREEIYQEDISYNIYKIDADIAKEYDIDYLEKMLNRDPEDFIEKYCDY